MDGSIYYKDFVPPKFYKKIHGVNNNRCIVELELPSHCYALFDQKINFYRLSCAKVTSIICKNEPDSSVFPVNDAVGYTVGETKYPLHNPIDSNTSGIHAFSDINKAKYF